MNIHQDPLQGTKFENMLSQELWDLMSNDIEENNSIIQRDYSSFK